MPRRARFTIEDGVYHILTRGNNQQAIFHKVQKFPDSGRKLPFWFHKGRPKKRKEK